MLMFQKVMVVAALVAMLAGCAEPAKASRRRSNRIVPPSMQKNWRCQGTLYLFDDGSLYCDGHITLDIEGYTVTK
jgi:hypothetical protein